jgi:hypothetical protein
MSPGQAQGEAQGGRGRARLRTGAKAEGHLQRLIIEIGAARRWQHIGRAQLDVRLVLEPAVHLVGRGDNQVTHPVALAGGVLL